MRIQLKLRHFFESILSFFRYFICNKSVNVKNNQIIALEVMMNILY